MTRLAAVAFWIALPWGIASLIKVRIRATLPQAVSEELTFARCAALSEMGKTKALAALPSQECSKVKLLKADNSYAREDWASAADAQLALDCSPPLMAGAVSEERPDVSVMRSLPLRRSANYLRLDKNWRPIRRVYAQPGGPNLFF
jgi:hypothetical protein